MELKENTERHIFGDFDFISTKDRTAISAQLTGAAMTYMLKKSCSPDEAVQAATDLYIAVLQKVQMLGQSHE